MIKLDFETWRETQFKGLSIIELTLLFSTKPKQYAMKRINLTNLICGVRIFLIDVVNN